MAPRQGLVLPSSTVLTHHTGHRILERNTGPSGIPAIEATIMKTRVFLLISLLLPAASLFAGIPLITGTAGPSTDYFTDEATQLWIGSIGTPSASSTLAGGGYGVKNLSDHKAATAWVEGKPEDGIGEWVEFKFDKQAWEDKAYAFAGVIYIVNGYAKTPALFRENNRVKTLRVSYNGRVLCDLALADTMQLQTFRIQQLRPANCMLGDTIRFEIRDVYRGTKYRDTCLTELSGALMGN